MTEREQINCCGNCGYRMLSSECCPICGISSINNRSFINKVEYQKYWEDKREFWLNWIKLQNNPEKTTEQGNAATAKHYQIAEIQPIEIMQMYFSKEEMIGYLRGNILKYNLRYGNKDLKPKEVAKLAQYSIWLEDIENGRKIDPRKGA